MKVAVLLSFATLLASCAPSPSAPPVVAAPAESTPAAPPPETRPERKPEPQPAPRRGKVSSIAIDQIFPLRLEGRVLMVDVRRKLFHQLGHIDGSINLPLVDFENAYPGVKPQLEAAVAAGKVIVVYCQNETCPDSRTTADALAARGFDVAVYRGGLDEWRAVGVDP